MNLFEKEPFESYEANVAEARRVSQAPQATAKPGAERVTQARAFACIIEAAYDHATRTQPASRVEMLKARLGWGSKLPNTLHTFWSEVAAGREDTIQFLAAVANKTEARLFLPPDPEYTRRTRLWLEVALLDRNQ